MLLVHDRTNTVHYTIHGFHHKHPMDADRLVFPPLFTMVIAIPVRLAAHLIKLLQALIFKFPRLT